MKIDSQRLETKIRELLGDFYRKRKTSLAQLDLIRTLKRKNPYLYKAVGVQSAADIIGGILAAFVSSSDETFFGNVFFEPLAKWAADEAAKNSRSNKIVTVGAAAGVDITIEDAVCYMAIAVKSGTNIFNGQSRKRQLQEFDALRSRLSKLNKRFDAIVGYGYGRKKTAKESKISVIHLAGQEFWRMITGEEDFYIRFMESMRDLPKKHALEFREEFIKAENRFVKEFLFHFSLKDGSINWAKLASLNSGSVPLKLEAFTG